MSSSDRTRADAPRRQDDSSASERRSSSTNENQPSRSQETANEAADRLPPPIWPLFRRALPFLTPDLHTFVGMVVLALVVAALGAAEPLVTKYIFDGLTAAQPLEALAYGIGGLVVIEVARAVLDGWMNVILWSLRLRIDYRLREAVIGKLCALPLAFHRKQQVGGLVNRINKSIEGFLEATMNLGAHTLPSLVFLSLSLGAMLKLDVTLSLVIIGFLPVPTLIGAWAAREQAQRERKLVETWSEVYGRLHETLSSILTVKGFAREQFEVQQFLDGSQEGNSIVRKGIRRDTLTDGARTFVATFARITALGVGGYLVATDEMTVGTLVAFLGYIGSLFEPVQGLTGIYQTMRRGGVSLEVLYEILDAEDAVRDRPDARDAKTLAGAVSFDNVCFAYPDSPPVLHGITLDVQPGEMIALVGPSGAGKSTLITLLQRHYNVSAGRISVDGANIRDLTLDSLRRQMGTVYQEVHLFNDTVHANIAFGHPDASRQAVTTAATAAQAHDFIMDLPDGYETVLGEQGSRLSGGQKQRLAIARALLLDPAILILDEATSALDAESEAAVQQALHHAAQGRTTFVIAHRLSTVTEANRIVVMQDGEIADIGRHADLLRRNDYYARLVRLQSNGMLSPETVESAAPRTNGAEDTSSKRTLQEIRRPNVVQEEPT